MMIFLDMDGVLCDFIGAAMEVHGSRFDPETYTPGEWEVCKVLGISIEEFWIGIDATPGFWENLKPYPWVDNLVRLLGNQFVILTSPNRDPSCLSQKAIWLRENVDMNLGPDRFMMGSSKYLLSRPGRILIDDSDKNCVFWERHGGSTYKPPQVWNSRHAEVGIDWVGELAKILELERDKC